MKKYLFLLLICFMSRHAQAQSIAFSVQVSGKGIPIILIPGFSSSGEVWAETVKTLETRYECHVLTLAGYAGVKRIDTPVLKTVRDGILAYVKEKKLNSPVLMGHSLGAFMSLWLASISPGSFSKIVCVDGVPFVSAMADPSITAESIQQNPAYNAQMVADNFAAINDSSFAASQFHASKYMVTDTVRAWQIARWSVLSDRRTLGYTMVEMSVTDLRQAISSINIPVLILGSTYGTKEATEKIFAAQYAMLPNKEIYITDSKHFIMYDKPDWFYKKVTDFLCAGK